MAVKPFDYICNKLKAASIDRGGLYLSCRTRSGIQTI
jgi:hypothetical protein